jgi:predicted GH43/DUF377 family glycosyl hydrolase
MTPNWTWKKLGRIYQPSGELPWARTHAANPVAERIADDRYRIYFSARDEQNRSSVGYVVIDLKNPHEILEVAQEPVLTPGDLAMFDDSGASIGCIVSVGEVRYLYYMGWNLSVTVPWKNAIGLAISEGPDKPFKRYSRFPIIGLDETDPYTISYPWVMREDGRWRMWYGSNLRWGPQKRDMLHVIKYAESDDGIHWERGGRVVIDAQSPEEYAICKPCVVKDANEYWMWYCSRGDKYRIHVARSQDGIDWEHLGQDPGIDVSDSGWDSDMIEYPSVFDHGSQRYMLYAGNDFAKTGFGLAVLEPDAR